ncbi:MAG: DNA-binding LytR/AlgR family response regulator [Saprospiraceae bacterium]|jgi:DNA-binding LytR/AlgR family response regulator|tara:strand:- start:1201 stop:1923 length:723 start_codon:yes stop_codon:yes gene_type:complete
MARVIIVDDEPLALDVMETYVEKLPSLELVARCENAVQAFDVLSREEVDIMFLDIQMPQLTGIDFLKSLSNPPLVIFTTAYPNYAIEGYELNVIDYLLKPISFERFMKAVNKALSQLELQNETVATSGNSEEKEGADFIFVKADKKLIKINYADILYIEGLKDYVIIKMATSRVITLQTMKSLEAKLPANIFKRIHRSYIVNLDKIDAVIGNMVEVEKKHLPIGKNYREELLNIVNENRL